MKKQWKPWLFITSNILTVFNFLVFISIRSMWSGIIRYTAEVVPYLLLCVIFCFAFIHTIFSINKKHPALFAVFSIIINLLFLALNGFIISLTLDAWMYFVREFLYSFGFLGILLGIYCSVIYLHSRAIFQKKWFPTALFISLLFVGFFLTYDLNLRSGIDGTPVVYSVNNEYQIVFKTYSKGTAWVTIDGIEYNETYAGYRKTENSIHKIIVPSAALDHSGTYTVSTRSMLLRGPYSALQGKTVDHTYHWRGLNAEDGLNYYVLSDTHNTQKSPALAGSYFGNSLDFLISCGDNSSWIDREEDLTQMHRLAASITKGAVPVIYARGNHETKGVLAHQLYNYVGADGENFYYTFRIKNVWGVVLDIGEDHRDKYEEYYGAAKFNAYRRAQTEFLDQVLENAAYEFDAKGVDYRIAICHIPVTLKYTNDHAKVYKDAWIKRLNKMKLNVMFGGHVHQLWYIDDAFEDGATLTLSPHYSGTTDGNASRIMSNANFPSILVSRRSEGQLLTYPEKVFDDGFWGLAVSSDGEYTTMKYTNDHHEVMKNITSPWFKDINYGSEIIIENVK
jgi:hypothetical protein